MFYPNWFKTAVWKEEETNKTDYHRYCSGSECKDKVNRRNILHVSHFQLKMYETNLYIATVELTSFF